MLRGADLFPVEFLSTSFIQNTLLSNQLCDKLQGVLGIAFSLENSMSHNYIFKILHNLKCL